MSKTKNLTVTLNNIPADVLRDIWAFAKKESLKDLGALISETDNVVLDFNKMVDNDEALEIMQTILAASFTCLAYSTASNAFGQ